MRQSGGSGVRFALLRGAHLGLEVTLEKLLTCFSNPRPRSSGQRGQAVQTTPPGRVEALV